MLEPTPVGHFSKLGAQTIQNVTSNDSEYLKFLKYFGRVFKHPVSVALEFYSNRPDAQFIASKGQWERADYHVAFGAKGINFLDQKGTLITLYDFEDVIEEIPPKRWSVTQNNVSAIRSQLHLAAEQPLFMELESSVTSPMDDLSIIQDLGLAALPDTDKLKFRDSYHNMIQVMLTGRLEVNGARYRIQPDRAALGYCQTVEQKFYLLTAAASAARKALTSLEYAFDTLRTQNELIRKEAKENEIRRMAEAESGRKAESVGNGLSAATAGGTSQRDNISESDDEGRTDRLVSDTGSRNAETGEMVSGDNNGNSDVGDRNDRTAVSSESTGRTLHSDDSVRRTDTGGRTSGTLRQNVDGEHGEELPGESRNDDVLSQVSDGSEVGGQESGGILRSAERTVRQEQSTSSEQPRSNDNLGDNEEIRNRTSGNDGNSSRSDNDSLNVDTNINAEIAEKWDNLDVIVDNENGSIDWVYYNPDSLAGGQLVINHIYDEQFQEAARFESSYDFLISSADQELVDITSSDFASSANHYLDVANSGKAAFVSRTNDTKVIEQYLQNYGKKLQQNNNKYAEYRASLRNTVYTRLNDTQRFNFSHCKYVEEPKNSIWGEIDNAVRINNGIFQVTTASHGGIMIKSEIAKTVLSREAQKIAQKDNGWHFFEEDCAYAAAMREIVDKDLFSDINSYFSRQYNQKPDEFLSRFNDVINTSLQRWFKSYWDKRKTALYNTLSPEEQAEEIGQLSFSDNTVDDTSINEGVSDIQTDLQALFSVEINGEHSFYKVENKTADDILSIATSDEPYLRLNDIGNKISEAEYAEIQQSAAFTYSVDVNLDNKSAVVYSINDNMGGIAEGDRTDENTSVTTIRLADYKSSDHIQEATSESDLSDNDILSSGPIVDGVDVYSALAAEIDRGTGFVNGKLRVQEFYEKSRSVPNHPTVNELADCLKKEYGIGGHSGDGNISMVDYDRKGMTFSFQNGEKFRHTWFNVASLVEYRLRENIYLSPEQQEQWQKIKSERSTELNFEPYKIKIGDQFKQKATQMISEVVSLPDTTPYYKGEYTVKRLRGSTEITENVSYNDLVGDLYQYVGNVEAIKAEQQQENTGTFEIYQLKSGSELRYHRFTDYETLHKEGNTVDFDNYELKYTDKLHDGTTLEDIYTRFNTARPEDFTGHSLSVSDVIVIHDGETAAAYYIDDVDYKKVPEFLQAEQKPDIVEKFRNKTALSFKPINNMSAADIENMVKDYIEAIFEENNFEAKVGRTVLYGSRSRGIENDTSDIDIVAEVESTQHEDTLFNVLHETEREIGGYVVDINPIRKEQTGTLEDYLIAADKYLSEKAANIDTPDYEQAIHEGFTALYANHTYTDKQKKFLERLERFAANNNVTENIVSTAFENGAAFRNTYANKEYVSRNLFARRLGSTEKELESNIRAAISPQELETKVHQVITNAGSDGGIDDKKEYASFAEAVEVGQKYIEDGYLGFAVYNQNTQMIERVEGDFPITQAFNDTILRINGINEQSDKGGLVIVQVGDFWELYGEDARKAADVLGITLMKKSNEDMCGFSDRVKDEYCKKLLDEGYTIINGTNIEHFDAFTKAKQLINDFCEKEYKIEADFRDMHSVSIAYTTLLDDEFAVQVTADLIDLKIIYEFNNEVFNTEQYDSIEDMVENGLTGLNFDELVSVPDEVIEKYLPNIKDYSETYTILSRCKQDCTYTINRAEHIDSMTSLNKYLYGGSVDTCINTMRELYDKLPDTDKPEWLSLEDINDYERQLNEISANIAENPVDTNINAEATAVATSSNDVEQLTDELNAQTLSDVEVGDILLLKEPESGEMMYFRIDSMQDNFMVSMSRVADDVGNDFTEIGLATKGIIDGHWKETLLDENTDSPILRFTKSYQEELRNTNTDNTIINIPEYGISIDLKEVDFLYLRDDYSSRDYGGYVDSNGNIALDHNGFEELKILLTKDGFINSEEYISAFGDELGKNITGGKVSEFTINKVNAKVSHFIRNAEKLEIYTQRDNVKQNIQIKEATVDTNINEAPVEERVHKRASRAEMLYREFTEAYPDMANGTHTYERYGDEYDEYGENDAFEPLSLEYLGDDTYSFMTWYVLNGDLMRDPDFVFSLDHENKELHVWEFQMDGVPSFGTLYERVELDDGSIDRQLQASLEDNFRTNLRNAIAVKRELTVYKDINGEEHNLKPDETEVKPEKIEINDSSAYYRETLNAFSEKHSLGELNLKNADNGFHITEKFKDGISVPMWFIAHREPTLLTISELEKELELIEKQAERNKTDVSEMNFRQRTVKEHAGMTELPMVQDDLPEINLVSDPREKISNNNIALIELERLRIAEANGIYPFSTNRNDYNSIDNSLARLRGYSGWGGVPQLFDETFSNLKYWRDAIKSRLTPEEYANARRTTLTSHYTPQVIIDAMYKTIRNMGLPKNSRILEPSCGTGNFIARMPHDMGKGGIVGVEIDSVTADIAKYLNVPIEVPNATEKDEILRDKRDIRIINSGFERSGLENNSFDLAIGNVPFGEFKLNDPDYTDDWYIHDAFFRKALDKVAPGGIVAFVTSTGTLDKKNPKIREYLATRADLVGAVRLPNNAFADAGTSTSTDIVFLQKRKELLKVHDPKPDWCYTLPVEVEMVGKKYEGEKRTAYINSYFVQNPQMVLGTIKQTTHFDMLTCEPIEGKNLKDQLDTAFRQLNAKISIDKREQSVLEKKGYVEPWGKSFTYQIKDDKVFFNSGNAMEEVVTKGKNFEKYKALCELRDTTRELLEKQVTTSIDYDLTPLRNKLNEQYDNFVKEYGNTTSKSIVKLFRKDADYPILAALESVDPDTKAVTKADIFTRRTVNPIKEITEVDTIEEAMQVSLDKKGKIDIGYMSWLLQHKYGDMDIPSVSEIVADELIEKELVFKDPAKIATGKPYAAIVDRSEYLCGDVRRKLIEAEQAAAEDNSYAKNVEALKEIIPEDIGATEISVDLGCTWIDTEDYEAFIRSLSGRSENDPKDSSVQFSNVTGQFKVGSSRSRTSEIFNTNEISTYGTEDMNMYRIIENLLNQRKVQVFDYIPDPQKEGKLKSVINSYKTKIAQSKAKEIKKAFSEWIFATDERKEKYVKRYNERFNSIVGRSYDGSHLTFTGLANKFELRKHQLNCIARSIYGGNTLAAHCVGAGKSAVIAASVMKKKELGLIHKACVVVPKPLTEQTEREWRMSFPDAKLFVLDNKDLSDESKRELFTARVATGDYDAVIMSQEQFEKLAMSPEYQADYLDKKISEMRNDLEQRKRETGRRDPSIKELEVVIIKTERQIENIMNPKTKSRGKDNLLSFETLGFDYLVADEAHAYKNGYVSTKMGDVQGVNTNESGRSGDMLMKCDYFNNEFGNGHILFATGTPVSNSMSELYVMTRYLRPDLLENCGCSRFDDWVATFGMIKTQNKKTATGELKLKTCFAGFKNRPELMKMYKEFADLVALDKLLADPNSKIVVPKIKGGKPQVIEIEATPEQREIVKDFARRGRDIQSGKVRPDEDNLLKITGEARLVGLGNKAVAAVWLKNEGVLPDGFLEDDKSGKIDECVKQTAQRYFDKYDDKAVQIIFSDIAVNSDDGKFSAYEYIRAELIAKGVKADEIIFAPKSDAKNRSEVFRDINEAKYRIVIGSTGTIGTGANIQKHLYALHHLDIPWRPSDFEQREGRIVRQGNLNSEVEILNYVTKGTLDSYLYQGVTDKARGIAQLWNDSNISRTSEDIDEKVLTFGELEAAAEGNPKLREYSELKNKIDEMQIVRADYNRETTRIERSLKEIPDKLAAKKKLVEGATKDLERIKAMRINDKLEFIEIKTHTGQVTSDRAKANKYIADKVSKKINSPFDENPAFYIKGFKVSFATTDDQGHPAFAIQGERSAAYRIECGVGENSDNYQRLLNFFDKGVERQIEKDNAAIDKLNLDYKQSQERVKAPFPGEDEYNNTLKAFEELEHELTAGGYLDSGEELTGADDYNDYETEKLDTNVNDTDDMDISEYNSI